MQQIAIEEVTWQDVRQNVMAVNPTLAELIDHFDPGPSYTFFKARYPYGANILERGTLLLPTTNGRLAPITDPYIAKSVASKLAYSSIPFGIWLNSSGEAYIEMDDRILPLFVFRPGSQLGLWEVLDPVNSIFAKRSWNVAVGSRSLYMLPKIADNLGLNRLVRSIGMSNVAPPKSVFDHGTLFSEIINDGHSKSNWYSEVLYFSKKWFEERLHDKLWLHLQYHLLKKEWGTSIYHRNRITFELISQAFAGAQSYKNLRPSKYLVDTVMCLITIGVNATIGFQPIISTDESSGPIREIQRIFVEHYGLKDYIPTIFQPRYLPKETHSPIYYSLQTPTVLSSSPNSRTVHSVLEDVRMTKRLLEALQQTLEAEYPAMFNLIKHVDYTFYHSEADEQFKIYSTSDLPKHDPHFLDNPYTQDRDFCDSGSYIRGCVKIMRKN